MRRGIGIRVMTIAVAAVANVAVTGCRREPTGSETDRAPAAESADVQEWEVLSREQAGIPELAADELLARVRNWVEAARSLPSWEAHYDAGFTQASPSVREAARVRMVCAGRQWAVHLLTNPNDDQQMQSWQAACDGNTVRLTWPDDKRAQIFDRGGQIGFGSPPTLPAFLPQLPSDDVLRQGVDLRAMLSMLDDPKIRLSPSCTRVDGKPCYVLERVQTLEYPVFQSRAQADQWRREHAEEDVSTDGSQGAAVVVDPGAKPDQKITRTITMRLAVDPELGFAIVRWARGLDMQVRGRPISIFPDREVVYHDFRKVGVALNLPSAMEFNVYHQTSLDRSERFQQFTLDVEDMLVQPQVEAGLFDPPIPGGYTVLDATIGIGYVAGESAEELDALTAAAEARDAFYRRLQEGPAPPLEASMWIGSEPINLAGQKGRPIILHFWGIDCAPCMHELPRLQEQYGNTIRTVGQPLFVSIHPYVAGAELKQVRQLVKQRGITFPVMIDAPYTEELSWGRTFQKYRVFAIPSEISIDETGRVEDVEIETVSKDSRWIGKTRDE